MGNIQKAATLLLYLLQSLYVLLPVISRNLRPSTILILEIQREKMSYRQTSICEPNEDIKSKFKINVLSVEKHQLFGLFGCPQTEALNT
jgi:hypothetical protein